ncbi:MAG TPA: polysaccharide deacetylase family protein [Chthoniobacteraceae bacterium]|nr:polysaccharide deacetylase family protein [Chthoniobacteraceae bacterium]
MLRTSFARSALAFFLLTGVAFGQASHPARSGSPRSKPASHSATPRAVKPKPQASPKPKGPQITYTRVDVDGPYVAITFDDGPHKTLTPKLLDLLASRGIKATFFVLGERVVQDPAVARQIVTQGHEIADHSWSHPNLGKMSDANVQGQLERSRAAILKATGVSPKVFRPPYGSFSERQRRWAHEKFGYLTILWDVDPLDWKRPGPSVVAERILSKAHHGSIILVHDIHSQSIDAMPKVLDTLLSRGYRFVTVSELIRLGQTHPRKTPVPTTASPTGTPTGAPTTPTATPAATPVRVLPALPVHPADPAAPGASPTVAPAIPVAPPVSTP